MIFILIYITLVIICLFMIRDIYITETNGDNEPPISVMFIILGISFSPFFNLIIPYMYIRAYHDRFFPDFGRKFIKHILFIKESDINIKE